ncbi:MAG: hypothetical protein CMP89_11330 [Gammaproteobacteria bacterium]|nr:hypothetical protein [Gammaproteobacteria bacterium]
MKIALLVISLITANLTMAGDMRINELQFIGSHNSYKKAMLAEHMTVLKVRNPEIAAFLDYHHIAISEQLDIGIRKLELDVFYEPGVDDFTVGHIQVIDMQSNCVTLRECLRQLNGWSLRNPDHIPIWISFNAKDNLLEGLPAPNRFDSIALASLDQILLDELNGKLILPRMVLIDGGLVWPKLEAARGTFLVVLDEGGIKRDLYLENGDLRVMFTTVDPPHPAAAIQIINDPVADFDLIQSRVLSGFMVRTRADANTIEARQDDTTRRDKALASGAQVISTDYYQDSNPFKTGYSVTPMITCNPILGSNCRADLLIE